MQISLSTPCAVDATHRNSQRGKKNEKRVGGRAWAEQSRQERWTRRGAGRLRRSRPFLKRRAASASKPQVRMPAGMANLGQWGWVGGTGSGEGCYHSSLVVLLQSQGGCVCSVVILKLVRESGRRGVISMFSRSGSWYWRYPLIWNTWAAWRARAHAHVCAHARPGGAHGDAEDRRYADDEPRVPGQRALGRALACARQEHESTRQGDMNKCVSTYQHCWVMGAEGAEGASGPFPALASRVTFFYNIVVVGAAINSKGLQARFPPADVADRLLFSALTAATEWPMDWPVRGGKRR